MKRGERELSGLYCRNFFTTGMAFDPKIADAIQPPEGKALDLLLQLAKRHQAFVGGSLIMRDEDHSVRNAFFLATPDGKLQRHDKDLPTMWENCFYTGGEDKGILQTANYKVGAALCWEFMRSQTAKRLRGQVDVVVGGSCWWSIPQWKPTAVTNHWEEKNATTALKSVRTFASYVGAPVIHAAHVGHITCDMPGMPVKYQGFYEAGTMIVDGEGNQLALRTRQEGQGVVVADLPIGRTTPEQDIPNKFWLHERGILPAFAWNYQRWYGKRWYNKHVKSK